MNVIALYDQFTTTWEKVRANITSHVIAAGLLWFVGFSPALPQVNFYNGLVKLQDSTLFPMIKGVGVLALVSLFLAFAIGTYSILLSGIGRILTLGAMAIAPPMLSLTQSR